MNVYLVKLIKIYMYVCMYERNAGTSHKEIPYPMTAGPTPAKNPVGPLFLNVE